MEFITGCCSWENLFSSESVSKTLLLTYQAAHLGKIKEAVATRGVFGCLAAYSLLVGFAFQFSSEHFTSSLSRSESSEEKGAAQLGAKCLKIFHITLISRMMLKMCHSLEGVFDTSLKIV